MSAPATTVSALMRGLVDYAGLFPPASRELRDAAARYAAHRGSPASWMLGRFVVPAERLEELAAAAPPAVAGDPWRLSVLVGADVSGAAERIGAFRAAHGDQFVVDSVELRPTPLDAIADAVRAMPVGVRCFVELARDDDPHAALRAIGAAGAAAKLRTGGIIPDAFPGAARVASVIAAGAALHVPFKATAGLHHPVGGVHALTYEPDAPRAPMLGFLNLFCAAVLAGQGVEVTTLAELVADDDPSSIELGERIMRWRAHSATREEIERVRATLALSFGSCSFSEPVEGLSAMRLT